MMSENKVGTYRFVAEPFHCDFSGKLTMSVLGNHLLNCAGFHAADRGFGIATLNENHYTWVLSRLAVELENMPCQYEGFSIQTWVENVILSSIKDPQCSISLHGYRTQHYLRYGSRPHR